MQHISIHAIQWVTAASYLGVLLENVLPHERWHSKREECLLSHYVIWPTLTALIGSVTKCIWYYIHKAAVVDTLKTPHTSIRSVSDNIHMQQVLLRPQFVSFLRCLFTLLLQCQLNACIWEGIRYLTMFGLPLPLMPVAVGSDASINRDRWISSKSITGTVP